ncbi:MAG: hypothetical protein IPK25_09645 [Saprospiraceae bacterium]|nr:hypothetical protein [Saprospiraceae bacterium]
MNINIFQYRIIKSYGIGHYTEAIWKYFYPSVPIFTFAGKHKNKSLRLQVRIKILCVGWHFLLYFVEQ